MPESKDVYTALAAVDLPRRGDARAHTTFSVLYSLRRILRYHDTVLYDRYPVLARFTPAIHDHYYARSISYLREGVPADMVNEPWVTKFDTPSGLRYSIDQFHRAAKLLCETPQSKRALVDFGEGFKARCVMTWLFVIRNGRMRIQQHMRRNDLVVGMLNNLIDARIAQAIFAAITGTGIGELRHQASLMQIYRRDVAGIDTVAELGRLRRSNETCEEIIMRMSTSPSSQN